MTRTTSRFARRLVWSLGIGFASMAICGTAVGQANAPACQRPVADSVRRIRHPMWPLVAAIGIAPSGSLLVADCSDTMPIAGGPVPASTRNFAFTLSASAGLADDYAHSENAEMRYGKLYLGFRSSHQDPNTPLGYRTARIGRFVHQADYFEGGVSAGYRFATQRETRGGPELAFPLRVTGRDWSLLLESSYVFGGQTFWNYRLECDYPLHGGPLFAGWLVDANEFPIRRDGHIRTVSVGLVFGVHR